MSNNLDCVFKGHFWSATKDICCANWLWYSPQLFVYNTDNIYYRVKYRNVDMCFLPYTRREKQSLLIRINQPARLYLLIWWRHPSSFLSLPVKIPFSPISRLWGNVDYSTFCRHGFRFIPLSYHPSRIPVRNCVTHLPSGGGGDVRMSVTSFLIRKFRFDGSVKKITPREVPTLHRKCCVSETSTFVQPLCLCFSNSQRYRYIFIRVNLNPNKLIK